MIGIEPAKNLSLFANKHGINTINNFFSESVAKKISSNYKNKAKIVINNHSLSNIHNINDVIKNVSSILDKKGIYTIQTFYTADVLNKKMLENFNHEHLHYFYVTTLDRIANRHGLEVFKAHHVNAKGGSIRTYVAHKGEFKKHYSFKNFIKKEKRIIKNKALLISIEKFIKNNKREIAKIIKNNKFKKILAYGTSIGATTFATQYNLAQYIKFFIDDDKYRQKTFSPGYNIFVTNNKIIKKYKPDLIIVLAPLYAGKIIYNIKKKFGTIPILKIWPRVKLVKNY